MQHRPAPAWLPAGAAIMSLNYFPAGGAGLGWHTDSTVPGWRIYLGRQLGELPGEFLFPGGRYEDRRGVVTCFYVSGAPGESWHALRAECARISVGLRLDAGSDIAQSLGLDG